MTQHQIDKEYIQNAGVRPPVYTQKEPNVILLSEHLES